VFVVRSRKGKKRKLQLHTAEVAHGIRGKRREELSECNEEDELNLSDGIDSVEWSTRHELNVYYHP
jgi:hypothetical protein